jgi:hypothetical protein
MTKVRPFVIRHSSFVARHSSGVAKSGCRILPTNRYSETIMHATAEATVKVNKAEQAETAFAKLLADASRRGFYGTAGLTLAIQDGHIQHIRVMMERMIK